MVRGIPKGCNFKCGFLKCGKDFVREPEVRFPGDGTSFNSLNIRFGEGQDVDTRTVGYNEEISFGAAVSSVSLWGDEVADEEARLGDPENEFIPFEDLMAADVDGNPLHVIGDDIVDESLTPEDRLRFLEEEDQEEEVSRPLKPGEILFWRDPKFHERLKSNSHPRVTKVGGVEVIYLTSGRGTGEIVKSTDDFMKSVAIPSPSKKPASSFLEGFRVNLNKIQRLYKFQQRQARLAARL